MPAINSVVFCLYVGKMVVNAKLLKPVFSMKVRPEDPAQERDITRARIANETGGLRFGVNRIEMQRPKALILDDTYISPVPGSRRPCMVRAVSHRAVAVSHRQTSAAHREFLRPYRHTRKAR